MNKLNISFDFDSTLSEDCVQEICKELQNDGHNIFVTTTRVPDHKLREHMNKHWNDDLWKVCNELNIPKENVTFTEYIDKYEILDKNGIDIHIDDDEQEIILLNKNNCKCKGILLPYNQKLLRIILNKHI